MDPIWAAPLLTLVVGVVALVGTARRIDRQLDEVVVRRSSGSTVLDQAALNILRRASPFDPFPEAIRIDYDQLRFAYKWQFNGPGSSSAAL